MSKPIRLLFFHDVLCGMCCVAAERLDRVEAEFGGLLVVEPRPYPLRREAAAPCGRDLRRQVRLVQRAIREPEGAGLSPALWSGIDPPQSSLPPLLAAEAALLQGSGAQRALLARLRTAALRDGVNVARRDVLLELAAASGLEMERFCTAFDAPATLHAVERGRHEALRHGVRAVPAIVIGDEWLLSGVRELHEYREVLLHWLERRGGGQSARVLN